MKPKAICGYFADQLPNRRLPMLFGLLTLAGATALLQVGSSIALLILGRVLQGVSAAIVWTVGLALLVDTVGQREIGMALGWVGISMSISQLVAPTLGGVVFLKGSYDDVFSMAYILLGLDVAFRMLIIEKKEASVWNATDSWAPPPAFTGTRWPTPIPQYPADEEKISLAAALHLDTSMVTALPRPPPALAASPSSITPFISDLPSPTSSNTSFPTCLKPWRPTKCRKRPSIIVLLSSRRLHSALWGVVVQASLLTSFDSTIPLYCSQVFGWKSIGGGLIFLPLLLPSLLSPWIGSLVDRYGARWFATAGYLLAAPFLALLRFVVDNDMVTKVLLCTLLVLIGLSLNLTLVPVMAEISHTVEEKEAQNRGMFGEKGAYAQVSLSPRLRCTQI